MKTITVEISWEEKNYCCGWSLDGFGAIICTAKSIEQLKSSFESSIKQQAQDMVADGEEVPAWLASGEYRIEYNLAVSALLRQAEQFTTMAAISRVTGINQKLLSHYANSVKNPRQKQRDRIITGLHDIGNYFLAVR